MVQGATRAAALASQAVSRGKKDEDILFLRIRAFERYPPKIKVRISLELFSGVITEKRVNSRYN